MKHLQSVALFLLLLFALDRGCGLILASLFEKIEAGESSGGLVNLALKNKDASVIVFGNSRARHHVAPAVMESMLGVKVHNAGSQGQGIHYQRILECLLMDAGTAARIFVKVLDIRDLESDAIQGANSLSPFYGRNARADELLSSASLFAPLKYQLHTYRYNSLLLPIVRNVIAPEKSEGDGFKPLRGNRVELDKSKQQPVPKASEKLKLREGNDLVLGEFIQAARDKGIQVVGVVGPRWRIPRPRSPDEVAYLDLYRKLGQKYGMIVLDLDEEQVPALQDPKLYFDADHLNAEGAVVFSTALAQALKPMLSSSLP